jgi:hypothetical protein
MASASVDVDVDVDFDEGRARRPDFCFEKEVVFNLLAGRACRPDFCFEKEVVVEYFLGRALLCSIIWKHFNVRNVIMIVINRMLIKITLSTLN